MKKEFSKGNRVRKIAGEKAFGEIGEVIGRNRHGCWLVQFDKDIGGHDGNNFPEAGRGKYGHCWYCLDSDLELVTPDKLIFKGNETILIKDGKEYISKCNNGDTYDKEKGLLLCLAKANGVSYGDLQKMIDGAEDKNKEAAQKALDGMFEIVKAFVEAGVKAVKDFNIKKPKPEAEKTVKEEKGTITGDIPNIDGVKEGLFGKKVKEVKRPAKVGEYIKIVNADKGEKYKNGDIFKVKETIRFKIGDVRACCDGTGNTGGKGYNYISKSEYVVLENYKPYKITLSEFWKSEDKLVIHCKTEEEAKELGKAFGKVGKKWRSLALYTKDMCRETYKENTCYSNDNGFCDIGFYKDNNYKIYEFNEVDLNN